jgi:hypothetical protein
MEEAESTKRGKEKMDANWAKMGFITSKKEADKKMMEERKTANAEALAEHMRGKRNRGEAATDEELFSAL